MHNDNRPRLNLTQACRITLLLIGLCWLWGFPLQAAPEKVHSNALIIPEQYGEVIFQRRGDTDSNLYIIANGHRSAISGANSEKTVDAQLETFRIGEWLIQQNQLDLLLPEGFFGQLNSISGKKNTTQIKNQVLQDALLDTSLFVNAELLLHEKYGIALNQVEDRGLYCQTRDCLRLRLAPEATVPPSLDNELAQLQKLRTVAILKRAPQVIETAYRQGQISSPNAMLTIGLAHLENILLFLRRGQPNITEGSPSAIHARTETRHRPLSTMAQVNVTVIVPRSLVNSPLLSDISGPEAL